MSEVVKIDFDLGAGKAERFEDMYFQLNRKIMTEAPTVESRNGTTKEILNFKTILTMPEFRCVGGFHRDVNIFFLLAEAMWIWTGRRDVAFLEIFNSRMRDFSDNGSYFHAPYGWRMRKYDVNSNYEYNEENNHATQGLDQLKTIIQMIADNPEDRRIVMQIWNAGLDLNQNMIDIPCNDLIMFKVRDNRLYTTIQNRSNDLHWGLLTNVFQFSFVTEMICRVTGCIPGEQVHNSNSLHCYTDLHICNTLLLEEQISKGNRNKLYDYCEPAMSMMHFSSELPESRLNELDFHFNSIILGLLRTWNGEDIDEFYYSEQLPKFSRQLKLYWDLLKAYVMYKRSKNKSLFFLNLRKIQDEQTANFDVVVLAFNFLLSRMTTREPMTFFSKDLADFFSNKGLF